MRPDGTLFVRWQAWRVGVDRSLRVVPACDARVRTILAPPQDAPVPGPKVTREEMNEIMPYDTAMVTWTFVNDIVDAVPEHEPPNELIGCLLFRWSIWLAANTRTFGNIFGGGIRGIHLVRPQRKRQVGGGRCNAKKKVFVHSESGFYMISTKQAIIKTSTEFSLRSH